MIAITVFIVEFKLDPDLFSALMPYFGIFTNLRNNHFGHIEEAETCCK